jgi:SAM-dependent methyltransferase
MIMSFFIPKYDSLRVHELLLSDSIRTRTYQRAIETNVKEGDIVIDVGTGTGILALFAAKAGAKRVYAIEPTGIIDLAKQIAKKNNLAGRIEFIKAKAEEVDIPEQVDCIVSEWLGVFALQENMLPSVASMRDRFLKPKGKMLPETVNLFLSLVEDRKLYDEKIGRWKKQLYGLDYTDFASCQVNDIHISTFAPENYLSAPIEIINIDMKHARNSNFKVRKRLKIVRNGICHGLAGWFQAVFPDGIVLDTAPDQPLTEWWQSFFPIAEPVQVNLGEELIVSFATKADNEIVHFIREIVFPNSNRPPFVSDTRKVKFSD